MKSEFIAAEDCDGPYMTFYDVKIHSPKTSRTVSSVVQYKAHISACLIEFYRCSRTLIMWPPEGQAKSVHNSEVPTLVKLGVVMGH